MIQRVLAAKSVYHARMGIALAGYMKIFMPVVVVLPGLILFAQFPEVLDQPWNQIRPQADQGYIGLLQMLIPIGLRGFFLAALFGAIQSTVAAVINSTSTVFTMDIYKRMFVRNGSEGHYVRIGRLSSFIILIIAIVMACFIGNMGDSLFVFVQTLYAFFAPPFSAIFVLGILFRRINAKGATAAVFLGFILSIIIKIYVETATDPMSWLVPFQMQAIVVWTFCTIACVVVSLLTEKPRPDQITDQLTINWKKINIFEDLGGKWYRNVVLWWGLFVLIVVALVVYFS
jgi:SSS family solute:Na+ symporter